MRNISSLTNKSKVLPEGWIKEFLILQQKVLFSTGLLSTYEEVCNKAIKYCLENLI